MAVNSATLITKISEKITLNGNKYDNEVEKRISGITDIYKRIVSVPARGEGLGADITIATFKVFPTTTDNALDKNSVKYIRVTNLDNSVSATLSLQIDEDEDSGGADESVSIYLNPGESFMMFGAKDYIAVQDTNATIELTLHDLESILVDTGDSACSLEVVVASTVST